MTPIPIPQGGEEMSMYGELIIKATGCTDAEARDAEEIMRHDIFHSTLDWQPRPLFIKAARLAVKILRNEPIPIAAAKALEQGTPLRSI
jgi:hypothetical protein